VHVLVLTIEYTKVYSGDLNGRHLLGRTSLKEQDNRQINLKETGSENMNWIHLVRNEEQWRAFVDAATNFGFHKTRGIY
jgi:hypothetical protein